MNNSFIRLFAISMAMALGLGTAAQLPSFHATLPSGQSLRFEVTSPTTCCPSSNHGIVGERVIIPPTVSDGTHTYTVTAMGHSAIVGRTMGGNTKLVELPNTLDSMYSSSLEQFRQMEQLVIPASVSWMQGQAIYACNSLKCIAFLSTTPPATSHGWRQVFGYRQCVERIYVPAGATADYLAAFGGTVDFQNDFPNATFHEWGTATPTVGTRSDTLFSGMPYCLNGSLIISGGTYTDSAFYYTHDSLTTVTLTAVPYSFYADAPTGQRLYYRIIGADSVEVVAPNDGDWNGYSKPAGSLTIPAAVTHGGTSYSVVRVSDFAFHICTDITSLTLSEGIAEVEAYAFEYCEAITYVSLPRSLRTIGDVAFGGMTRFMNPRNLTLASDTIWAETIAVSAFGENIISQPIVLPNVRTIDFAAFANIYRCPYIFVGDSCTSIGANAFDNAFNQLPGRISLGTSLQTVGNYALSQPATIRSVEFRGATVPSFGEGIFYSTQVDSIITPCGTSAAYRTALYFSSPGRWDPSNTVFAERGCQVVVDLYDAICAGGSYTFGGQTAFYVSAASVELYDTVHYALYDSITVMHLTVNATTTGDTAAVACDQFSWYGTDYTASATPTYVLTNAAGCDSTVTLALTINYSTTGDTVAVACDAFTWYGTDYTSSATPTHVLTNAAGCDSTVTLALTINYSNTGDTVAVACDQFSWYGTDYTASATPTHVLTNAAGCDSTVTLALTVNYSNTGDTAAVACDQFTWYGTDYTASATPTHVLTNAAGCDSTVTLNLTVRYSNSGTEVADVCDTYTWQGTTYTASNNTDVVTLTNAAGCDSTVTLSLTVRYSNSGTEVADVCDTYTWQGTTYTASNNTDVVTLTNAAGCDSTVTLNLTVRHSSSGDTAAVAFDQFGWYGQTYTASGSPTHVLTNAEGCDSTVTLALTILEGYAVDNGFGENGIEVEAYGYCAGPGAVRYRLSSGQPDQYTIAFAAPEFPRQGWTDIATPGSIDIEVPQGLAPGNYTASLVFRNSAYPDLTSAPILVTVHVNLPETYVRPLFNDVIALVDTCHCLTNVQWYHREAGEADWTAIPGANDYVYHQPGGLTGEYFASARFNGVDTYTCPQVDVTTLISDAQPTLTVWPNPTTGNVTLDIDGSQHQTHQLRIMSTVGVELERRTFDGNSLPIDLSGYPKGSYVVSVDGMMVRVIRN